MDNIFKPIWTDNFKAPTDYTCEKCNKIIKVEEVKYATNSGYECYECFNK